MRHVFLKEYSLFSVLDKHFVMRVKTLFSNEISAAELDWLERFRETRETDVSDEQFARLEELRLLSDVYITEEAIRANERQMIQTMQPHIFMHTLELMVAQSCNMHCEYCYGSEGEYGQPGLMTRETAFRAIELYRAEWDAHKDDPSLELPCVIFFGGEPLLNLPLIRECIEKCESIWGHGHVRFGITTNLTLMTEPLMDYFIAHNVSIVISFDGTREYQSRRVMNDGRDSYDMMLEKIHMVLAKRPETPGRATIYIGDDCDKVAREFERLGFKNYQINAVSGNLGKNSVRDDVFFEYREHVTKRTEYVRTFCDAVRARDEQQVRAALTRDLSLTFWLTGSLQMHAPKKRLLYCGSGRSTFALSVQGKFYPCHRFVGQPEYCLGSLDSGIDRRLNQQHPLLCNPKCQKCGIRYACGHPCMHICACDAPDEPGVSPLMRAPEAYCANLWNATALQAYLRATITDQDKTWLTETGLLKLKQGLLC